MASAGLEARCAGTCKMANQERGERWSQESKDEDDGTSELASGTEGVTGVEMVDSESSAQGSRHDVDSGA